MDRGRTNRRGFLAKVDETLSRLRPHILQARPYLPDLLNQPEFLMVPEFGKLIAVYVMTPRRALTWRTTLAAVEDLFELKHACGESTIAVAVIASENPLEDHESVYLHMLANLFDGFVTMDSHGAESSPKLKGVIAQSRPRTDLFPLWRYERRRISENLSVFAEERFASFIDQERSSRPSKETVLRRVKSAVDERPALRVVERYKVRSPKEVLAGLPERNQFVFDLGVESVPQETITPVDVAVLGRYGSRSKLRYLMTKARLTSYGWDGRLYPREVTSRPVLAVSGNIAGPRHDPYRYVRALVSVGWELVQVTEQSIRGLLHGNV